MKRIYMSIIFFIMVVILSNTLLSADANIIRNQYQSFGVFELAYFYQEDIAQSFMQNVNNIAGAGIKLNGSLGADDSITISLYDALPNAGGKLIISGTINGGTTNTTITSGFTEVFWTPTAIIPNTTYFLVFTSTNKDLGIRGIDMDSYKLGYTYADTGFIPCESYDFAFETFYDDGIGKPNEPGKPDEPIKPDETIKPDEPDKPEESSKSSEILVKIDIKPGSKPNSVNLKSKGVIPVAILTTKKIMGELVDFDAITVDVNSVVFGPAKAMEVHKKAHFMDVDVDGDLDMVLHFDLQDTGIKASDTQSCLTGKTTDGKIINGIDAIVTVPSNGKTAPAKQPSITRQDKLTVIWGKLKSEI